MRGAAHQSGHRAHQRHPVTPRPPASRRPGGRGIAIEAPASAGIRTAMWPSAPRQARKDRSFPDPSLRTYRATVHRRVLAGVRDSGSRRRRCINPRECLRRELAATSSQKYSSRPPSTAADRVASAQAQRKPCGAETKEPVARVRRSAHRRTAALPRLRCSGERSGELPRRSRTRRTGHCSPRPKRPAPSHVQERAPAGRWARPASARRPSASVSVKAGRASADARTDPCRITYASPGAEHAYARTLSENDGARQSPRRARGNRAERQQRTLPESL
jgi:hypothetical protein